MKKFSFSSVASSFTKSASNVGSAGNTFSNAPSTSAANPLPSTSGTSATSSTFSNSMVSSLSNITMKMSAASSMLPSLSTDTRRKDAENAKNAQLKEIMQLLEDVRLQSPQNHSGLIVAYSMSTMAPLYHPGLKYTWYRLDSVSGQLQLVDDSYRSWYAPGVDDVGSRIMLHCEDVYGQGFTRYVECDPIPADPLLQTVVESTIENSYFEVKDVSVSLGIDDKRRAIAAPQIDEDVTNDANTPATVTNQVVPEISANDRVSALLEDEHFLQMNGRSAIVVDESGLFISIPVEIMAESNGLPLFVSKRGLRIPKMKEMKVYCTQLNCVIIEVPIRKQVHYGNNYQNGAVPGGGDGGQEANSRMTTTESESEASSPNTTAMESFLTSSVLSVPWSLESGSSPEALVNQAQLDPSLNSEEAQEKVRRETEMDSLNYANLVVSLTEFVAALPEKVSTIKMCFSCQDRMKRDALFCSIQTLVAVDEQLSFSQRTAILPWNRSLATDLQGQDGSESSVVNGAAVSASTGIDSTTFKELQIRLKYLENENIELKREKSELTSLVMEQRQNTLHQSSQHQGGLKSIPEESPKESESDLSTDQGITEKVDKASIGPTDSNDALHETVRKMQLQIIEFENKLSIANKKESEIVKLRKEMDQRNEALVHENDKLKAQIEESKISNTVLKHEKDSLEHKCSVINERLSKSELRISELVEANKSLEKKVVTFDEMKSSLESRIAMLDELQRTSDLLSTEKQTLSKSMEDLKTNHFRDMEEKQKLIEALEQRVASLKEQCQDLQKQCQELPEVKKQLAEAQDKESSLTGQLHSSLSVQQSLSRDMKRQVKQWETETFHFQRALKMKNIECVELQQLVYELQNELKQCQESAAQSGTSLFINMPNIPQLSLPFDSMSFSKEPNTGVEGTDSNGSAPSSNPNSHPTAGSAISSRLHTIINNTSTIIGSASSGITGRSSMNAKDDEESESMETSESSAPSESGGSILSALNKALKRTSLISSDEQGTSNEGELSEDVDVEHSKRFSFSAAKSYIMQSLNQESESHGAGAETNTTNVESPERSSFSFGSTAGNEGPDGATMSSPITAVKGIFKRLSQININPSDATGASGGTASSTNTTSSNSSNSSANSNNPMASEHLNRIGRYSDF